MTSDRRFFSGDSLAQALNQAAQHFQTVPAEINYKLVEKRHGFLKVRRKVVIEVDSADPRRAPAQEATPAPPTATRTELPAASSVEPSAEPSPERAPAAPRAVLEPEEEAAEAAAEPVPERAPAAPRAVLEPEEEAAEAAAEPVPERAPAAPRAVLEPEEKAAEAFEEPEDVPQEDDVEFRSAPLPAKKRFASARGEEAEAAGDALARILELAGLELESEILQTDDGLLIELQGSDQDVLLRDRGRLLLAIQHLLPRAIRGLIGRSVACKVDSDDFHMIREERLRDLAQRAADEVRGRGRPKTLEPMSPDERRIVHLTLADYPGVETESHGSGLFKRVMVRATKSEKPGAPGPYKR